MGLRVHIEPAVVERLEMKSIVALQAEVAAEVAGDRGFEAVEAFAVATEINARVRIAGVDFVLVVIVTALRPSYGAAQATMIVANRNLRIELIESSLFIVRVF